MCQSQTSSYFISYRHSSWPRNWFAQRRSLHKCSHPWIHPSRQYLVATLLFRIWYLYKTLQKFLSSRQRHFHPTSSLFLSLTSQVSLFKTDLIFWLSWFTFIVFGIKSIRSCSLQMQIWQSKNNWWSTSLSKTILKLGQIFCLPNFGQTIPIRLRLLKLSLSRVLITSHSIICCPIVMLHITLLLLHYTGILGSSKLDLSFHVWIWWKRAKQYK